MATRTWNKERATKRIDARLSELPARDIEIREYVRDTDLTSLPMNVAYRVDGVHLYADILNLASMLNITSYDITKEALQRLDARLSSVKLPPAQ